MVLANALPVAGAAGQSAGLLCRRDRGLSTLTGPTRDGHVRG